MTNDKGSLMAWLIAAGAVLYAVSQSVPAPHVPASAATIIVDDPQPTPELAPPLSPPPPAEPQDAGQDAPAVEAVEWLTWPEASALSKETGRPVLVLQKFRDPKADAACLPCQRLKRTLEDDVVLAVFAGQGIPCLGYAEDWQSGPPTAPTIAYVSPGAAPSDKVHSLSGFRVAPADAFLEDLTEWIENVRSK